MEFIEAKSISLAEARKNPDADPILTKSGADFAEEGLEI